MHRFYYKNCAWKVKNSENLDEFQFYSSQDKEKWHLLGLVFSNPQLESPTLIYIFTKKTLLNNHHVEDLYTPNISPLRLQFMEKVFDDE